MGRESRETFIRALRTMYSLFSVAAVSKDRVALGVGLAWMREGLKWRNPDMKTSGARQDEASQVAALLPPPAPGERILDLAAGTGTSSVPFARAGAIVVPTDFSLGMLRVGKERQPSLPFVAGDGMHLPFRDESFDVATISFGLRNIHDRLAGLRELHRVVRPGGRLVVCDPAAG